MALFKKKENNVDTTESKVVIGNKKGVPLELPPLDAPKDDTQTLYEAILGMSEVTFKVELFALLLEVNQRLINQEAKLDEILKIAKSA